jgi:hypothetical protein
VGYFLFKIWSHYGAQGGSLLLGSVDPPVSASGVSNSKPSTHKHSKFLSCPKIYKCSHSTYALLVDLVVM